MSKPKKYSACLSDALKLYEGFLSSEEGFERDYGYSTEKHAEEIATLLRSLLGKIKSRPKNQEKLAADIFGELLILARKDSRQEFVAALIRSASQYRHKLELVEDALGVRVPAIKPTDNTYEILKTIIEKGPIRQYMIAEHVGCSRNTVSRTIKKLKGISLVEEISSSGFCICEGKEDPAAELLGDWEAKLRL